MNEQSLYAMCSYIMWLYNYEEVEVRSLSPHVRRPLTAAYWKEQVIDSHKGELFDEILGDLGVNHKGLIIETALDNELDGIDLQQQIVMQTEDRLADDIQGYLDDFARDYRDSNGLAQPSYEYDELCVEARG